MGLPQDSLNFHFWPSPTGLEYQDLALGLKAAMDGPGKERFEDLHEITPQRLRSWLPAPHEFPLFPERLHAIRALGEAIQRFGPPIQWVREANRSAARLVDLVAVRLPPFRDETVLRGTLRVCFYKRAQILVGDVWAAFAKGISRGL